MRNKQQKSIGYALSLLATAWLCGVGVPIGHAQGPYADDAAKSRTPTWMTHRASFRVLSNALNGGDLGPGESSIPGPLATEDGATDQDTMSWSNVRLRYDGVIHLGASLGIHLGLDALDNLVLGSTPEMFYPNGTMAIFSRVFGSKKFLAMAQIMENTRLNS